MTQASDFYAERAFSGFVKKTINNCCNNIEIENAVVSILACASALEGATNRILELKGNLDKYKRSSMRM